MRISWKQVVLINKIKNIYFLIILEKIGATFTYDPLFSCLSQFSLQLPTIMKVSFSLLNNLLPTDQIQLKFLKSSYVLQSTSGCTISSDYDTILDPLKCLFSADATYYILTITTPTIQIPSTKTLNVWISLTNQQLSKL